MKTLSIILSVMISFLIFFSGCSSSEEEESSSDINKEQVEYYAEGIVNLIGAAMEGEELPPGATVEHDPDSLSMTLTLTNMEDTDKGFVVNGTINGQGTKSADRSTITLHYTGTLTLTGAEASSLALDMTVVLPWDESAGDFAGDPTSLTGTLTVDGTAYDLEEFDLLSGGGSSTSNPQFLIAGYRSDEQGKSVIPFSGDGSNWSYNLVGDRAEHLRGIECNASGDCVAVGDNGLVFYSSDGINWSAGTSLHADRLRGVAYGNNRWVMVGVSNDYSVGVIYYSDDGGATWKTGSSSDQFYNLGEVTYGNGIFIAVSQMAQQFWSSDGATWNQIDLQQSPSITNTSGPWLNDIVFDSNNTWVGVGENGLLLYTSDPTDDTAWHQANKPTAKALGAVDYGKGKYIAVSGENSNIPTMLKSADGQVWSEVTLPSDFMALSHPFVGIAYGNDLWVSVSGRGDYLISTDLGKTWNMVVKDAYGAYDVTYRQR